jgi:hypothetical protein
MEAQYRNLQINPLFAFCPYSIIQKHPGSPNQIGKKKKIEIKKLQLTKTPQGLHQSQIHHRCPLALHNSHKSPPFPILNIENSYVLVAQSIQSAMHPTGLIFKSATTETEHKSMATHQSLQSVEQGCLNTVGLCSACIICSQSLN